MNKNSEIRRRKNKDQNVPPFAKKKSKSKDGKGIPLPFITIIICGFLLLVFMIFYADNFLWEAGHEAVDNVAVALGYSEPLHAVVIDAGSTGSRVLAFTFHKAFLNREYLILDKELFVYTKPGLSSFADDPKEAVASISKLVEKAKNEIPENFWTKTPIILKATAGLRLLPTEKAEGLLNAMRVYFKSLPFLTHEDSVSIMDGTDEGIFSWFTVNFLLNNVNYPAKTVAALDLGGGSTQVTFSASTPATLKQKEFIHQAQLPNGYTPVYTNSYLGLGLMAARKEILTYKQKDFNNITSPCVNPIITNQKFPYGGTDYYVSGIKEDYPYYISEEDDLHPKQKIPIVQYEACEKIVREYVISKVQPPVELAEKKIFAFSYYFDRAAESGLIDFKIGGIVTINEFKNASETSCLQPDTEQPFLCLDLTFIKVLLQDGLGLDPETRIYLFKKLRGHEISWALGAAFNRLKMNA